MSFTTWDSSFEASPATSEVPTLGDDRIREAKTAIRQRMEREHILGLTETQANHGWHRQGSSIVYYQDTAPTNLPDDITALGDNDYSKGRLWVDSDDNSTPYVWDGTDWVQLFFSSDGVFSFNDILRARPAAGTHSYAYVAADARALGDEYDSAFLFLANDEGSSSVGSIIYRHGSTGTLRLRADGHALAGDSSDQIAINGSGITVYGNETVTGDLTVSGTATLGELDVDDLNLYSSHIYSSGSIMYFGVGSSAELVLTGTKLGPYTHRGLHLGESSNRFHNLYLDGTAYLSGGVSAGGNISTTYGNIVTSDGNISTSSGGLTVTGNITSSGGGLVTSGLINAHSLHMYTTYAKIGPHAEGSSGDYALYFYSGRGIVYDHSAHKFTITGTTNLSTASITTANITTANISTITTLDVSGAVTLENVRGHIESDGYLGYNSVTGRIGKYSSARSTKTGIKYGPDTSWIYDLNLASYNYKGSENLRYGFIADDLIETVPELVTYNKDGSVSAYDFFSVFSAGINELQKLKDELRIAGILN